MRTTTELAQLAKQLRLPNTAAQIEQMVFKAQQDKPSYIEFLKEVFSVELNVRKQKEYENRLKAAKLPPVHDLDHFDYNFSSGISRTHMKQLRELVWVQALDDEVLATALLDRLLYHCEVIRFQGTSYRMENRKTIFKNKEGEKDE